MATNIDELVVRIKADTKQLNEALDKVKKKTKDTGKSGKAGLGGISGALSKIKVGAIAATAAFVAMGAATKRIAEVGMAFEDLQISLNTVFGGIEGGQDAFDAVIDFAKTTPFQIEDVTKAFIRLKSAGLEPDIEMLKAFGDAASIAGNATEAFAALVKIASKATGGGLGLEELEQLETQGIAVYPILRKELGLTRDKIADFGKTTEGAALIIEALQKGLKETTGGTMAARMENLSTITSNLTIAIKELSLSIFNSGLGDFLKESATDLTNFVNSIANMIKIRNKLASGEALSGTENVSQINSLIGSNVIGHAGQKNKLALNIQQAIDIIPEMDMSALREMQQLLRLGMIEAQDEYNTKRELGRKTDTDNIREVILGQIAVNTLLDERIAKLKMAGGINPVTGNALPADPSDVDDPLATPATIDDILAKGQGINAIAGLEKLKEKVDEANNAFLELDRITKDIDIANTIMIDDVDQDGNKVSIRKYSDDQIAAFRKFVSEARDEITNSGIEEKFGDIKSAVESTVTPFEELQSTITKLQEALDSKDGTVIAFLFGARTPEEIESVMTMLRDQLKDIGETAEDTSKTLGGQLQQAVINASSAFTTNFVNALMDGQSALSSFKDFAKNIVSQIISIFLQMAIVNEILNSVFKLSGSNAFPTFSNTGGGGGSGGYKAAAAGGGAYQKGVPTLVGERGPELIIPNTGGRVMNGMNTKNAMGGGDTIVVNQSLNFSTGVVGTVRAEINKMMPTIAEVSKSAVLDASRRGGNYRKGLLGSA